MMYRMIKSSDPEKSTNFDCVTEDDKIFKIYNKLVDFAETMNNGVIETLGQGFLAKSPIYTVVMLGDIVRINYYSTNKSVIFHYVELYLSEGEAYYNIDKWPSDLMKIYQDIIDIANS